MRVTAQQVIETGVPAVFDCGFTNLEERKIFYDWAEDLGFSLTLHFLDVDPAICWDRVQNRNRERGETFMLEVTRGMFDFMLSIWQPPGDEELMRANGIRVAD